MSLVHHPDQIGADVIALECHHCHHRHSLDETALLGDPLRCIECGTGGLVPHAASRLGERFGDAFTGAWTPLPEALMDQRAALGLEPHDLLIIWALERHRRVMGDVVYPGQQKLAALTGLSIHQVRRTIRRLIALELIIRHAQPGSRGKGGRARVQYDLDPLWHRLFGGHQYTPTTPQVGEHERAPTPAETTPTEVGAHQCTQVGAQNDAGWCAESTPEVDVEVAVVVEEEPEGTSPAEPDVAANTHPATEHDHLGEDFAAWQRRHPKLHPLESWRQFKAEQAQTTSKQAA